MKNNINPQSGGEVLKEIYVIKTGNRYMVSIHPIKNGLKVAIPLRELRELMKLKVGDLEREEVQDKIRKILHIN